jgi:RNA polymerase sigma-70 factor (ECF subfamily)
MTSETSYDFERLFSDYKDRIYRLARSLTGKRDDAEDVVQEVFFRVYKNINSFRGESNIYTWIYRITVNMATDYMKYRKKLPSNVLIEDLGYKVDGMIDPNFQNNPEIKLLSNEAMKKCLHSLTECLQKNERKVFCLSITLNLPYKTVAEILDCSVGYVKGTLHRAKKKWTGYMENKCEHIKKSNPCKCIQWVKFGLEQGWFKKKNLVPGTGEVHFEVKHDIIKLKDLKHIYEQFYHEKTSQKLVRRIQEGIKNREWKNIL